jgi:hypothetical protein
MRSEVPQPTGAIRELLPLDLDDSVRKSDFICVFDTQYRSPKELKKRINEFLKENNNQPKLLRQIKRFLLGNRIKRYDFLDRVCHVLVGVMPTESENFPHDIFLLTKLPVEIMMFPVSNDSNAGLAAITGGEDHTLDESVVPADIATVLHTHNGQLLSPSVQDLIAVTWEENKGHHRKRYVITEKAIIEYKEPQEDLVADVIGRIISPQDRVRYRSETEANDPKIQKIHDALTQLISENLHVPFIDADTELSELLLKNPKEATAISYKIAQEIGSLGRIILRTDTQAIADFFASIFLTSQADSHQTIL